MSYCHDNNAFCTEVLNLLRSRNDAFEIWIDRTHCQGAVDLWESIADEWKEHLSLYGFFQNNILKVNHVAKNLSMLLILLKE